MNDLMLKFDDFEERMIERLKSAVNKGFELGYDEGYKAAGTRLRKLGYDDAADRIDLILRFAGADSGHREE